MPKLTMRAPSRGWTTGTGLQRGLAATLLALCAIGGCGDDAVDNDGQLTSGVQGSTGGDTGGLNGGGTGSPSQGGGTAGATNGGGTGGGATGMSAATGGTSGGVVGDGDGGITGPISIAGTATAASCLSYQPATSTMCGSYYCGVTPETLTAAIGPNSMCGSDPAYVCKGTLPLVVGACARKLKSANPLSSSESLRPQVQACAYEDAEVKQKVSEQCLRCYLDSAVCAGDNCLVDCLSGDSPACDSCRMKNNCTAPVFTCNGLPNPL